jgi:hypothetical protein
MSKKSGHLIFTLVLAVGTAAVGAVGEGCVIHAQAAGSAEASAPVVFSGPPTLVAVDGGIWVVRDADYPVYFVDDDYWVIRDGVWYRSHTYDGGWVTVEARVVPTTIVSRTHTTYVHFHGAADARIRSAPRPGETATATEHEDKPGVGNERKALGEQPGHVPHGDRDDHDNHGDHGDHGDHRGAQADNPAKHQAPAPGTGNEHKIEGRMNAGKLGRTGPGGSPDNNAIRKHDQDKDKK